MDECPGKERLHALVRAMMGEAVSLAPDEAQQLARHIMLCQECRATSSNLLSERARPDRRSEARTPGHDLLQPALAPEDVRLRERQDASELIRDLERHSHVHRLLRVESRKTYQTWAVCEALMTRSMQSRFNDAKTTLEWAQLALAATQELSHKVYGKKRAKDLLARAWAYLGNAQKIAADYAAAERSFDNAETCLFQGTGDYFEQARVFALKAGLCTRQERYDEALGLIEEAKHGFERAGDEDWIARVVAQQGLVWGYKERFHTSIELLRQALRLIDGDRHPRWHLTTCFNLGGVLYKSGRLDEARQQVATLRSMYLKLDNRLGLLRVHCFDSRASVGFHPGTPGSNVLLEARDGFIRKQAGFDGMEVSRELATLCQEEGRTDRIEELAQGMLPIFEAADIPPYMLAALVLFLRKEEATA